MSYAPYPAYKDSGVPWLGQVPEEWEIRRLKTTADTVCNGIWGSEPDGEDDIACIRVADFDRQSFRVGEEKLTLRSVKPSERKGRLLKSGDLLIEKSGGGDKQLVGAVVSYDLTRDAVCSNFVAKIEVDRSHDPRFLTYLHAHLYSGRVNYRSIKQTTGIQNLDSQLYFDELVAIPEINVQTTIADFLDKKTVEIDDLIAKKEELLRLLAEQRIALITHAVTNGLNPNAPMKPSGVVWFDQVPTHWQVRRLKDVGTLIGGAGFPHDFQNVQGEELFFYKVGDLAKSEDGIHLTSAPHTIDRETAAKLRAAVIPPDAILYAKIGAALLLNRRRISTANCCIDNNMTAWIVNPSKVLPLWGFYWMSTVDFGEHTNPGAVPSLSEGYQSVLPITLPPLDEQQAIVDQLVIETNAIDQTAKKTREAIERLREYRTALITNAVTGKIKVA